MARKKRRQALQSAAPSAEGDNAPVDAAVIEALCSTLAEDEPRAGTALARFRQRLEAARDLRGQVGAFHELKGEVKGAQRDGDGTELLPAYAALVKFYLEPGALRMRKSIMSTIAAVSAALRNHGDFEARQKSLVHEILLPFAADGVNDEALLDRLGSLIEIHALRRFLTEPGASARWLAFFTRYSSATVENLVSALNGTEQYAAKEKVLGDRVSELFRQVGQLLGDLNDLLPPPASLQTERAPTRAGDKRSWQVMNGASTAPAYRSIAENGSVKGIASAAAALLCSGRSAHKNVLIAAGVAFATALRTDVCVMDESDGKEAFRRTLMGLHDAIRAREAGEEESRGAATGASDCFLILQASIATMGTMPFLALVRGLLSCFGARVFAASPGGNRDGLLNHGLLSAAMENCTSSSENLQLFAWQTIEKWITVVTTELNARRSAFLDDVPEKAVKDVSRRIMANLLSIWQDVPRGLLRLAPAVFEQLLRLEQALVGNEAAEKYLSAILADLLREPVQRKSRYSAMCALLPRFSSAGAVFDAVPTIVDDVLHSVGSNQTVANLGMSLLADLLKRLFDEMVASAGLSVPKKKRGEIAAKESDALVKVRQLWRARWLHSLARSLLDHRMGHAHVVERYGLQQVRVTRGTGPAVYPRRDGLPWIAPRKAPLMALRGFPYQG